MLTDAPSIFSQIQVEEAGYRYTDDLELGLRLRYEIIREIAPYVGINWERAFGDAADELEGEDENINSFAGVADIRFWL